MIYHLLYAFTADGDKCTTKLVSDDAWKKFKLPESFFVSEIYETIEHRGKFDLTPNDIAAQASDHLLPDVFEEMNE